jgi:hypothetical protein
MYPYTEHHVSADDIACWWILVLLVGFVIGYPLIAGGIVLGLALDHWIG